MSKKIETEIEFRVPSKGEEINYPKIYEVDAYFPISVEVSDGVAEYLEKAKDILDFFYGNLSAVIPNPFSDDELVKIAEEYILRTGKGNSPEEIIDKFEMDWTKIELEVSKTNGTLSIIIPFWLEDA